MSVQGKPLRFNLSEVERGEDTEYPFCLSDKFRRAVLQATHRLLWSSAWVDGAEQPVEIDEDTRSMIERGIWRLSQEEGCSSEVIMEQVINIASPTQQQQQQQGVSVGNCGTPPPWQDYEGFPGGSPCYPLPPVDIPDDIPDMPVPPDDIEESEWEAYRCKLANYWYDLALEWFDKVAAVPGQLLTLGSILLFLWSVIPAALLLAVGGSLLQLGTMIMSWYAFAQGSGLAEVANFAKDWWVDNREELICKIYDATDIAAVANEIRADFLDNLAVFAETRPWWFVGLFDLLSDTAAKIMPLNLFTASWTLIPPPGYVSHTPCCGDAPGDISDLPEVGISDYFLFPAPTDTQTIVPNNNTAQASMDGEGNYQQWPLTALTYHEVDIQTDISAVVAAATPAAASCHGMIIRVVGYELPQNNNDGVRMSSNTGGSIVRLAADGLGNWMSYYDNTEEPLHEFVKDEEVFDHQYAYGNGAMVDSQASFRLQTYGAISPKSLQVQVVYIMKQAEG